MFIVGFLYYWKVEITIGDVYNKVCDIYIIEYFIFIKIKILRIFNDMGKYYIILSENCVCVFIVVMFIYFMYMGKC